MVAPGSMMGGMLTGFDLRVCVLGYRRHDAQEALPLSIVSMLRTG